MKVSWHLIYVDIRQWPGWGLLNESELESEGCIIILVICNY